MYLPEVHLDLRDESGNACSFPFSCFSFFSLKKKEFVFLLFQVTVYQCLEGGVIAVLQSFVDEDVRKDTSYSGLLFFFFIDNITMLAVVLLL